VARNFNACVSSKCRRKFCAHREDQLRVLRKLIVARKFNVAVWLALGQLHALADQLNTWTRSSNRDIHRITSSIAQFYSCLRLLTLPEARHRSARGFARFIVVRSRELRRGRFHLHAHGIRVTRTHLCGDELDTLESEHRDVA